MRDLLDRDRDEGGGVVGDQPFDALREIGFQLLQLRAYRLGGCQGLPVGGKLHAPLTQRPHIETRRVAIGFDGHLIRATSLS